MRFNPIGMKFIFLFLLFASHQLFAQNNRAPLAKPKLVVGIVVDQMRPDYLYRFQSRYSKNGFMRLLKQGHECKNAFINYLPSYTGPGHACIYTGAVPALHGIASNDWYERSTDKSMYCTYDSSVQAVGGGNRAGKMSPKNMWSTTIGDELRLFNPKSKVIALSLKDRASILPGGHSANGAYWLDDSLGNFMTSSFYQSKLPVWVDVFNEKKFAARFMTSGWKTLYPISTYIQSTNDTNRYEGKFTGENHSGFPHNLTALKYSDIRKTCFGNNLITEFAIASMEGEQLGEDSLTDLLCVSYSSPDYVGHMFGPNSIEIEDTYLRLDQNIAELLTYLDKKVGPGNYTIFLTADHAVAHNPQFLNDRNIPAGTFSGRPLRDQLNAKLKSTFNVEPLILDISENYIWLKDSTLKAGGVNRDLVIQEIKKELQFHPEIQFVLDMHTISSWNIPEPLHTMAKNGYVGKRSGDMLLILNPGWLETTYKTGTTHGTWNPYDTHIPLVWYGWGIQPGKTKRTVHMTDIAITLATLLQIQMPNASIGECISEAIK